MSILNLRGGNVLIQDELIAMIEYPAKTLYVSCIRECVPNGKSYKIELSDRKKDAMFLDSKHLAIVYNYFSTMVKFIKLNTVEDNVTDLILRQMWV